MLEKMRRVGGISALLESLRQKTWEVGKQAILSYPKSLRHLGGRRDLWCATPRRGLSWQKVQKFIQLLVQIEYKLGLNRNH